MKTEAHVMLFVAIFFAGVSAMYWLWSYEPGGTAMLIGSALLGLVPGTYYLWWARRMRPRPEDVDHATIAEGAGVIGTFPSSSIWPFLLGLAASMVALALVFGFWTAVVGFVVAIAAVVGVILESRRGGYV